MNTQQFSFSYSVFNSIDELDKDDAQLLRLAMQAKQLAYAPYSNFKVGAAARLRNNKIVTAANQENASFPAGICAERNAIAVASSLYPGEALQTLAITYENSAGNSTHPISPCGICRQSLQEHETLYNTSIRIILGGMQGNIYIIPSANVLLPLAFNNSDLSK